MAPESPQLAPRWLPAGPKMAPRWAQRGPKMALDGDKMPQDTYLDPKDLEMTKNTYFPEVFAP